MKKVYGLLLAAALLTMPMSGVARAEKVDFSKFTCGEFIELDEDALAMFYFWLDGYFSAKSGNTELDTDNVENDLTQLMKMCSSNKNAAILTLLNK